MISLEQDNTEKYILVAVASGDEEAAWDSLDELAELLDTASGEIISRVTIERSIDGGKAYRILQDVKLVGGVVIKVVGDQSCA